jgi:hypothetical protein
VQRFKKILKILFNSIIFIIIILYNLPENIEKIFIYFGFCNYDIKNIVYNLPPTIKEIIIKKEYHKQFITKIPFGTIITIQYFDIIK